MTDPAAESKADKFKRLAEPRVDSTIKKIKLIGNLSASSYEYTNEQAQKILSSLRAAVDEVEKKFQKGLNRKGFNDEGKFHL
jgi:hypothetical protein